MAGAGAAEAGTDVVGVVVDGEVSLLARLGCRPLAEIGCVGPGSLGRLREREEPSIKGVTNLPGREAGLYVVVVVVVVVRHVARLGAVLAFSGGES